MLSFPFQGQWRTLPEGSPALCTDVVLWGRHRASWYELSVAPGRRPPPCDVTEKIWRKGSRAGQRSRSGVVNQSKQYRTMPLHKYCVCLKIHDSDVLQIFLIILYVFSSQTYLLQLSWPFSLLFPFFVFDVHFISVYLKKKLKKLSLKIKNVFCFTSFILIADCVRKHARLISFVKRLYMWFPEWLHHFLSVHSFAVSTCF